MQAELHAQFYNFPTESFIVPIADYEFSRPRSAMLCHPERSEGSSSMAREMLRCAQHDRSGFDC